MRCSEPAVTLWLQPRSSQAGLLSLGALESNVRNKTA
jgi:hypothetical protein